MAGSICQVEDECFPENSFVNISKSLRRPAKGLLLDITGVLYESGANKAIDGSVEAINKLRDLGVPFRFVTNETQSSRKSLVEKLQSFGFNLKEEEVFAPGPAVANMLKKQRLRPHLLVHPDILSEFDGCDKSSPNCVVIGDASEHFTYDNVNHAFQLLIACKDPVLISMGKGKYYRDSGKLVMDLGAYTAALEYACGIEAVVMGKPSPNFFLNALYDMGVNPEDAVMIGDDINSDISAAQNCGVRGVLVRTGKYRPSDEDDDVKPDGIVNNLAQAVDKLLYK